MQNIYRVSTRDVEAVEYFLLPLPAPYKVSGGGATRPLPRDGGVEELHGDPTVGLAPRSVKNGRSSAKDSAPEKLRCGTIQVGTSQIL